MEKFIDLCLKDSNFNPDNWKQWLEQNNKGESLNYELLGLTEDEYSDLENKIRSMNFYILKRKQTRTIFHLWAGCYVKFLIEIDLMNPHIEYGWVDIVSNEKGFCKIQCDDSFDGCRAVTIRTTDVIEVMPSKERPLVYFKTMMCGNCNDCDRSSNKEVPLSCKHYSFFNVILNKQKIDVDCIKLYDSLRNQNKDMENKQSCVGCHDEHCHCEDEHNKECNGECKHE